MLALVIIMLILLAWSLIAGRLARISVTMPLALLVAGMLLTAGSDPIFTFVIDFESGEHIVEAILAILLFVDATEVPPAGSSAANRASRCGCCSSRCRCR